MSTAIVAEPSSFRSLPASALDPPGIPVAGTLVQTGASAPLDILVDKNFISDPANPEGFLIPIPGVIQLSTSFTHVGPATSEVLSAGAGPGSLAWCPGATANPVCTTVTAGGTQGTLNGIITYTAGPNQFGGTMKVLLLGTGLLINKGAATGTTIMTSMGATVPALPFKGEQNPLGGGGGVIAAGIAKGGANTMTTGTLVTGVSTHPYGYMTTPDGLLSQGPVVGTAPALSFQRTPFGFTTGTIVGYRKIAAQAGDGGPEKFTVTGYDNRTAGGNGRIQLVAGTMSRTFPTDGSDPPEGSGLDNAALTLTFVQQPALPLSSPAALMTLGSLVMLSAGYAVSSRKR